MKASFSMRRFPCWQVNHIIWYYQQDSKPETEVPLRFRMFYPQEIDALLSYNGFSIEYRYGDLEETPYATNSQNQLIICR